ncbi:MAG: class I SAM-dependent methyltransferase [Bacteroidia bacterium]|nr:class I SAM-dependent methyltransferase [Bacteroidia bacterium]
MEINPFDIYTDEYEEWFRLNDVIFQSELLAIRTLLPLSGTGIEIGIGSGIFAEKLGINFGVDPSEKMLELARKRNLTVKSGVAENLPYPDAGFDFAVFITSLCFIQDPDKALKETFRILKDEGEIIIAFIDRESRLGQILLKDKENSVFYKQATFYSVPEINAMLQNNGFEIVKTVQTLNSLDFAAIETPSVGYGTGSFIVVKGKKITFR